MKRRTHRDATSTGRGQAQTHATAGLEVAERLHNKLWLNAMLRHNFISAMLRGDWKVFACPSMPEPPVQINPNWLYGPIGDDGLDMSLLRFTAPFDFSGAPTISLPCGLNNEGLPLSLQFVGKHLQEPLLCRIGHTYEQVTDWHKATPPD